MGCKLRVALTGRMRALQACETLEHDSKNLLHLETAHSWHRGIAGCCRLVAVAQRTFSELG